jgi:hypothetical protein
MFSFGTKEECWSLIPKLEHDYFVVIYRIVIYLLVDSIIQIRMFLSIHLFKLI